MTLVGMLGEAICEVVLSLFVAALLSVLGWTLFKRVHHPELGVPVLLGLTVLLSGKSLGSSSILQMILLYGAVAALLLWPVAAYGGKIIVEHGIEGEVVRWTR